MSFERLVLLSIGAIGLIWYFICLVSIGWWPVQAKPAPMHDFMATSVTTISATLATFVGLVLGLKGVSNEVKTKVKGAGDELTQQIQKVPPAKPGEFGAVPSLVAVKDAAAVVTENADAVARQAQPSTMQWVAVACYILSLLFALGCWWANGNDTDATVVNLGQSLLGLIAGALAALLNGRTG